MHDQVGEKVQYCVLVLVACSVKTFLENANLITFQVVNSSVAVVLEHPKHSSG